MKRLVTLLPFLFLSCLLAKGQYTDHRDHQLDSLEPHTKKRICCPMHTTI